MNSFTDEKIWAIWNKETGKHGEADFLDEILTDPQLSKQESVKS